MKVKLDENLPSGLALALRARGHDVDTVADEGLKGRDDATIWQAAQAEGRFLITQDLDFSDVRRFSPGTHAGLLLVRPAALPCQNSNNSNRPTLKTSPRRAAAFPC
jgi:predicted nuclease of predicted toxin-antitoxin system